MSLELVEGDLFSSSESLAHCVSSDLKMSRSIAVQFRGHFSEYATLASANSSIGDIIWFKSGNRYIFNLVTKFKFYHKPKYSALQLCLENLRDHLCMLGVSRLSVPKLGCGLDGLSWERVRCMMESTLGCPFQLCITVYFLSSGYCLILTFHYFNFCVYFFFSDSHLQSLWMKIQNFSHPFICGS